MENIPKSITKSFSSIRSFLEARSVSIPYPSDDATNRDGNHRSDDYYGNDGACMSDEDDCFHSTSNSTSITRDFDHRQSTLPITKQNVNGDDKPNPLDFTKMRSRSTTSNSSKINSRAKHEPLQSQQSLPDDSNDYGLTAYGKIISGDIMNVHNNFYSMLSGSVASIIPSQLLSCDPANPAKAITLSDYDSSTGNVIATKSSGDSFHVPQAPYLHPSQRSCLNSSAAPEIHRPYDYRSGILSMPCDVKSSDNNRYNRTSLRNDYSPITTSSQPGTPQRVASKTMDTDPPKSPLSRYAGFSVHPKRVHGNTSPAVLSSPSRALFKYSNTDEPPLPEIPQVLPKSRSSIFKSPSRSACSSKESTSLSPSHSSFQSREQSISDSISRSFSSSPSRKLLQPLSFSKIRTSFDLHGLKSFGSFLQRANDDLSSSSSDEDDIDDDKVWDDVISVEPARVKEPAKSPAPPSRPKQSFIEEDEDEDDTDDDDSITDEESSAPSTLARLQSFSFARSVSKVVDDLLLSGPNLSYDTRSITPESIQSASDGKTLAVINETEDDRMIKHAISVVEAEQKQRRSTATTLLCKSKSGNISEASVPLHPKPSRKNKAKPFSKEDIKHYQWFGHGTVWTTMAVACAALGVFFALLTRRSTEFVRLQIPLEVSPIYNDVTHIGMVYMNLCYNETYSDDVTHTGCMPIRLEADDIDDRLFNMSRSFLTLGFMLGSFLSIFLILSIVWESINLKPIGLGLLLTYFFQSFALLFFDTDLCGHNGCKIASGGIFCIVASFCWLLGCIATAKMDAYKYRVRQERRRERRKLRRLCRDAHLLVGKGLEDKSKATEPATNSDAGSVQNIEVEMGKSLHSRYADL